MRYLLILSLAASSAASCAGTGAYTVSASLATPDLVYVQPGVYAVANADQPVFYADNYYWLYADGIWYRSDYLTGGWHYAPPPYVITQIPRPLAYHRHYRPEQRVHVDIRDRSRVRVYPGERDQTRRIEGERREVPRVPPAESRVRPVPPARPPAAAPDARVIDRDRHEHEPTRDRD